MSSPFAGCSQRKNGWMRCAAAAARAVAIDLAGEDVDRARGEPRRSGRMRARAAVGDERREPAEPVDVEPLECVDHGGDAEDAGAALARAFVREITKDAR